MDVNDNTESHEFGPLAFIRRLLEENAHIAGDVVDIAPGTWAIHGTIPLDGEVLVAEFDSYDAARDALASIAAPSARPGHGMPSVSAGADTRLDAP